MLLIKLNSYQRFSVLEGRYYLMTLKKIMPDDTYPSPIKRLMPPLDYKPQKSQRLLRVH